MIAVMMMVWTVVEANEDAMKAFSYTFGSTMFECGEQANYTYEMATDILNYWKTEQALVHEQTGCLVVCALHRLELTDSQNHIMEPNAEAYARSTGADDDMVVHLLEVFKKCHRRTSTIRNRCLAALELSKCFRNDIKSHGWIPNIDSLLKSPHY